VWQSLITASHGYKYYIIFVDNFSCFMWLYPMKFKYKAFFVIFCAFHKMVENLLSTKIKYVHHDGGKNYDNTSFLEYLVANGIYF